MGSTPYSSFSVDTPSFVPRSGPGTAPATARAVSAPVTAAAASGAGGGAGAVAGGGGGGGLVPVIRGGCVYFVSPVSSTLYCMQQPESADVCVSHHRQTTIRVKRLQVAATVRPAPPRPTTWRLTHCLAVHWQVTLCAACAATAHHSNHGPAGAKRASETHVEVDVHAGAVVPVLSIPGAGPSPVTVIPSCHAHPCCFRWLPRHRVPSCWLR